MVILLPASVSLRSAPGFVRAATWHATDSQKDLLRQITGSKAAIHAHRMKATDVELLTSPLREPGPAISPRKAAKAMARLYHPDRFSDFEAQMLEIAKKRMQDINAAAKRSGKR